MRLLSLELEKFGAFADLRIAFRPDARLHVVYGPNEAGKSTALAAVGALLFGVPERTPYASRFPGQLRVGAEIAAADGRSPQVLAAQGAQDDAPRWLWRPSARRCAGPVSRRAKPGSVRAVVRTGRGQVARRRRRDVAGGRRRWRQSVWRRRPACAGSPNFAARSKRKRTVFSRRAPAKTAVSTRRSSASTLHAPQFAKRNFAAMHG